MYSAENGGLHLNARSGDWWGKSTVYSRIHKVVFLFVFKSMSCERIPVTMLDFLSVTNMNNVVLVSQVSNLCQYLCEESNELLTYIVI